jgi:hypothetical protein
VNCRRSSKAADAGAEVSTSFGPLRASRSAASAASRPLSRLRDDASDVCGSRLHQAEGVAFIGALEGG